MSLLSRSEEDIRPPGHGFVCLENLVQFARIFWMIIWTNLNGHTSSLSFLNVEITPDSAFTRRRRISSEMVKSRRDTARGGRFTAIIQYQNIFLTVTISRRSSIWAQLTVSSQPMRREDCLWCPPSQGWLEPRMENACWWKLPGNIVLLKLYSLENTVEEQTLRQSYFSMHKFLS